MLFPRFPFGLLVAAKASTNLSLAFWGPVQDSLLYDRLTPFAALEPFKCVYVLQCEALSHILRHPADSYGYMRLLPRHATILATTEMRGWRFAHIHEVPFLEKDGQDGDQAICVSGTCSNNYPSGLPKSKQVEPGEYISCKTPDCYVRLQPYPITATNVSHQRLSYNPP